MNKYENTITLSIFMLGIITVFLSVLVACKFHNYKKGVKAKNASRLSSAISWQLAGEAIIGLGTLIFSAAAYFGVLNTWPIELQSLLRFIMFFATSITTWHLYKTLQRLGD